MPPAAKFYASVIIFDVAVEDPEKAIQALIKICMKEELTPSLNLTTLFLTNTEETANRFNFPNIVEAILQKDFDIKQFYEIINNSNCSSANWLNALKLATECLNDYSDKAKGIVCYQVLFITDLKKSIHEGSCDFSEIIENLNKLDAFLYIIGPNVKPQNQIKSVDDVRSWMTSLEINENDENLLLAQNIIKRLKNGVICTYEIGIHLFSSFIYHKSSQPWKVPLSIMSSETALTFPSVTIRLLKKSSCFKFTPLKRSRDEEVWIEDETNQTVSRSQIMLGLTFHNKFVQLPPNQSFRQENPRSFKILGFTDSCNVPEYYMRGEATYGVFPSQNSKLFNTLVDCLVKQGKYVIARRVYNKDNNPKFVVLIPKNTTKPKCFLLAELPYADDINYEYKEEDVKSAPMIKPDETIYNFLNSIDVSSQNPNKYPLSINMMRKITNENIINKASDIYFEKSLSLKNLDLNYLEPEENLSQAELNLRKAMPIRSISE